MSQAGGDRHVSAEMLCPGDGSGDILWLDEPLSFWGGTELDTGVITDVHHPQHGVSLVGRIVVMGASRGSSSSSSVLAEQIRRARSTMSSTRARPPSPRCVRPAKHRAAGDAHR